MELTEEEPDEYRRPARGSGGGGADLPAWGGSTPHPDDAGDPTGDGAGPRLRDRLASWPNDGRFMEAMANEFSDLSGRVTVRTSEEHASYFTQNRVVVLVEHDLGTHAMAGWVSVTRTMLVDMDPEPLASFIGSAVDRHLRPWKHPDPSPLPRFHLFPFLSRLRARSLAILAECGR